MKVHHLDMTPNSIAPLTVVIPVLDEELNLATCLDHCAGWVREIIVVDSFSTDDTINIAKKMGARVVQHTYEGAPQQWKWILSEVPIHTEWMLAIDADYIVTPKLRAEITRLLQNGPSEDGYYIPHRQMFRGRFLRHGGMYPRHRLTLFRPDRVLVDERDLVDNRFYVRGQTKTLSGDLIEDNAKEHDFSIWMRKQIGYAERAAQEETDRSGDPAPKLSAVRAGRNERVLWLKHRWLRLPLYWRSVGYFLYRYVVRLGFLDGRAGFLYHFSQALAFRVMLDARVEELRMRVHDHGR